MSPDPSPASPRARHCVVLAGGLGRRIGGGKPLQPFAGRPLIERALRIVERAGLSARVLAKPDTDLAGLELGPDAGIVLEPALPRHPLLGIAFALELLAEPLVVIPCDLPLLPPALLAELAARPEPSVTLALDGRLQPLVGRYSPPAGAQMRAAAEAGRPASATVEELAPLILSGEELRRFGDPARYLRGVNTWTQLRVLEAEKGRGQG